MCLRPFLAVFSAAYSVSGVPLGWLADSKGHFGVCTCGVLLSGVIMALLGVPIWGQVAAATGAELETGDTQPNAVPCVSLHSVWTAACRGL